MTSFLNGMMMVMPEEQHISLELDEVMTSTSKTTETCFQLANGNTVGESEVQWQNNEQDRSKQFALVALKRTKTFPYDDGEMFEIIERTKPS